MGVASLAGATVGSLNYLRSLRQRCVDIGVGFVDRGGIRRRARQGEGDGEGNGEESHGSQLARADWVGLARDTQIPSLEAVMSWESCGSFLSAACAFVMSLS